MCEKICLPARAHLRLALPAAATLYAGPVEAALAAAPRLVPPGDFGDLSPAGLDGWRLCAPHQGEKPRDLFVEAPELWRMSVAPAPGDPTRDCFKLTLLEKPKDADLPVALRLTMTGGNGPVETTMDAGRSR